MWGCSFPEPHASRPGFPAPPKRGVHTEGDARMAGSSADGLGGPGPA